MHIGDSQLCMGAHKKTELSEISCQYIMERKSVLIHLSTEMLHTECTDFQRNVFSC
jgi:hypothetical protein